MKSSLNSKEIEEKVNAYLSQLKEEMSTTSGIAGIGAPPESADTILVKTQPALLRRKSLDVMRKIRKKLNVDEK